MASERTEVAALGGYLKVVIGGRPVELPVLKMYQSRTWKEMLGPEMAGVDVDTSDMSALINRLVTVPGEIALDLVDAYDVEKVLGGREAIEKRATDAEVYAALEVMVEATYPKGADVLRSAVREFGPQLLWMVRAVVTNAAGRFIQGSSTATPSGTGDSTPSPLTDDSPTSSSSSSGPTTSEPSMRTLVESGMR